MLLSHGRWDLAWGPTNKAMPFIPFTKASFTFPNFSFILLFTISYVSLFTLQRAKYKTSHFYRLTGNLPRRKGYGYIGARTDTTQQYGQTPDKEVEIKNSTVYVSGYTETYTTGMLSPPTVWRFSLAAGRDSNVFDFYFLIWSLSRLLCCVGSGFNVAAA